MTFEADLMQTTDQNKIQVMGILNVTPDSFYKESRQVTEEAVAARAGQILAEGGDMIDIGACSTRPGAQPVSEAEEIRRLDVALETVRRLYPDARLSVDTFREEVANRCIRKWGVAMINDISGGDEAMFRLAAMSGAGYVLTHNDPTGRSNTPEEVAAWLAARLQRLRISGVGEVWLDPGFGFNKTLEENWTLLHGLEKITALGAPVLVGVSRKSMIYKLLDTTPDGALNGTTVANTLALTKGAHILRVHDVREAVETIRIMDAMAGS